MALLTQSNNPFEFTGSEAFKTNDYDVSHLHVSHHTHHVLGCDLLLVGWASQVAAVSGSVCVWFVYGSIWDAL